jgi:hypothetical protein
VRLRLAGRSLSTKEVKKQEETAGSNRYPPFPFA